MADPTQTAAVKALSDLSKARLTLFVNGQSAQAPMTVLGLQSVDKAAGTYTASKADQNRLWRATGAVTINLAAAATLTAGWVLWAKADGGAITVTPNGSELINGASSLSIPVGSSAMILCTGTGFQAVVFASATGGNFSGPASSVANNIITFADTTGKLGKDSGVAVSSVVTGPASATSGNLPSFNGTGGKILQDSGVAIANLSALAGIGTAVAGDVIYASGAGVWARLGKGTARQAFLMNAAATLPQWTTIPFTQIFESAQQTITSGGSLTLAHGLGVKPKLYLNYLQCVTAEANYSIGDEILVTAANSSNGVVVVPDATNLNVRFGSNGSPMLTNNKSTGAGATLTNANWKLVVRAWA